MKAHDISNYEGPLSQTRLAEWHANGVGLIIPQSITPPVGYPPSVTRQQIEACAQFGMPTDAYLWVWTHSAVKADIQAKLSLLDGLEHLVGRLWLDAEDTAGATVGDRIDALWRAYIEMDAWSVTHGKPTPGLYTGRWWWTGYVGDTHDFSDRDLWDSDYDGVPDIDFGWIAYGGWTSRAIKQFVGSPLDTNVLSAAEEERVLGTPEPEPPPDTCAGVIGGLAYVADDLGDKLLAEARRTSVRKTVVRQTVAEMARVRLQQIGPRP